MPSPSAEVDPVSGVTVTPPRHTSVADDRRLRYPLLLRALPGRVPAGTSPLHRSGQARRLDAHHLEARPKTTARSNRGEVRHPEVNRAANPGGHRGRRDAAAGLT